MKFSGVSPDGPVQLSVLIIAEDPQGNMEETVLRINTVYLLIGVNFDTGSADIKPSSYESMARTIDYLKRNPDLKVLVAGHTDDVGETASNLQLSQKRAEAVRQYFIEQGVDPDQVEARGFGESEPVADNTSRGGREKNRRVELRILQ